MKIAVLLALLLSLGRLFAEVNVQSDRWMPMNGTPDETPPGYAIELLVEVFTDTDSFTYTLEPWADSIENAAKGITNAVIGAAKDEAPSLYFPKEPVAHVVYGLWAKKTSVFTYSTETLSKAKIGVIKGYTYWPELDTLVAAKAPNIVIFSGDNPLADAVAALNKGDIDLYPEAKPVFAWALKDADLSPDNFVFKHEHDGGLIYVAFTNSTRGRELADKWDARIAELRRDGTLAKILAKYGVSDWSSK
jgi:polar amino acid transport system substrate-binding protein